MKAKAWPFLVSRNRELDYTSVLLPEFLRDTNLGVSLQDHLVEEGGSPAYAYLADQRRRPLTALYRVRRAEVGGQVYRDHVGRVIHLVEGVILQGRANLMNPNLALDSLHQDVSSSFVSFWSSGKRLYSSASMEVELLTADGQGTRNRGQAWTLLGVRRRFPAIRSGAAVAIGAAGWLVWAWFFPGEPSTLTGVGKLSTAGAEGGSGRSICGDAGAACSRQGGDLASKKKKQ